MSNRLAISLPVRRRNNKVNSAFTLIEMLVVVLIIGILLAVAIPLYLSSVKTAADNTAENNCKAIATAATAYKIKTGAFPATLAALQAGGDIVDPSGGGVTYTNVGSSTDDVVTATAAAGTFSSGTTWTYDAGTATLTPGP